MKSNLSRPELALVAAMALFGLALAGCKGANESLSSGFASLECRGNTPAQIRDAARDVCWKNGYRVKEATLSHVTAEKEGSKMNNVAYGSWLGDTPVWIRVKLTIVPSGETAYRLNCQAFYVRDIGGATEEELRMGGMKRGPYEKLLDDIGWRLNHPAPSSPASAAGRTQ